MWDEEEGGELTFVSEDNRLACSIAHEESLVEISKERLVRQPKETSNLADDFQSGQVYSRGWGRGFERLLPVEE